MNIEEKKAHKSQYMKEYNKKNRARLTLYANNYYHGTNKGYHKVYNEINKVKLQAQRKKHDLNNREKLNEYHNKYYHANKDKSKLILFDSLTEQSGVSITKVIPK